MTGAAHGQMVAKQTQHPPHTPQSGALLHPDFAGLTRYQITRRPDDDDAATAQTVAAMFGLMRADAINPIVRRAAAAATQGNPADLPAAVFRYVKSRVRFRDDAQAAAPLAGITDPAEAEVLIRPVDLLTMPTPAGDCDCHAMLTGALLLALGIEPELVTIAADPQHPETYSHVYARARTTRGSIALDTSHGPAPGWEAPAAGKSRVWRLDEMQTLGAIDWNAILKTGVEAGTKIATARYGVAPEGTYQQTGESVFYRQPANSGPLQFPGLNVTGGYTWILAALGVLTLVLIVSKRN